MRALIKEPLITHTASLLYIWKSQVKIIGAFRVFWRLVVYILPGASHEIYSSYKLVTFYLVYADTELLAPVVSMNSITDSFTDWQHTFHLSCLFSICEFKQAHINTTSGTQSSFLIVLLFCQFLQLV